MKTKEELYQQAQDFIQSNDVLRENLTNNSPAAPHNILIGLFCTLLSWAFAIMDSMISDAQKAILKQRPMGFDGYIQLFLDFQYGDQTIVDTWYQLGYPSLDEAKKIIKFVEVTTTGLAIFVKVAKSNGGIPTPLNAEEMNALIDYVKDKGAIVNFIIGTSTGGITFNRLQTFEGDQLTLSANVYVDAEVFIVDSATPANNGALIVGGNKIVEEVLQREAINVNFGAQLALSKLTQAVLSIGDSVSNIQFTAAQGQDNGGSQTTNILTIAGQQYKPYGGFIREVILNITYFNSRP
jgi:hypothetical protein